MATITIKNIPAEIHEQLRANAEQHHRSLNSEIIFCLENSLRRHAVDADAVVQEARVLRKTTRRFLLTNPILQQAKNRGRA